MIIVKNGVVMDQLASQIVLAVDIAYSVYRELGEQVLVVTSVNDGRHMVRSLHYTGRAVDLRLPARPEVVADRLREALGENFDVVLEKTHIHVEFDPV